MPERKIIASNVKDYGFLIQEFFSKRYNTDVSLSDLADELHLSERHTERLVIEKTGRTFRAELATTRINAAKRLLENNSMTLSEAAELVGYGSYAGFGKAMKKYGQ